jgi:hypothetical protein
VEIKSELVEEKCNFFADYIVRCGGRTVKKRYIDLAKKPTGAAHLRNLIWTTKLHELRFISKLILKGNQSHKKSQFKERVCKTFYFGIEKKKHRQLSMGYHINAHLQYHTELCKTWSVYLLLLLVMVWISLESDTSWIINT